MLTLDAVLARHPLPFPPNPDGTPAALEQLQIEDINRLALAGRALADLPVGFGKTAISTYAALMLEPETVIIVMPPILLVQWEKWLRSIRGIGSILAYEGSPAVRKSLPIKKTRWLLMSYGIFRNDFEYLQAALAGKKLLQIVDECQELKNFRSKLFDVTREMSEGSDLFLLSGTPVSWPGDIYAYVKLNTPEAYRTNAQFESIHVAERDYFDKPTEWRELELMQKNFNMRRIYRSKEEVHSALPKANYIPVYYDLDKDHMTLYRKLMTEQLLELDDGTKIDASTAQTLYHQAQQIITSYGYFSSNPKKVAKVFDLIDGVCSEIGLGDEGASKLILWTAYTRTSAEVQAYMDAKVSAMTHTVGRKRVSRGLYSVAAYSGADSKKSIAAFLDDPLAVDLVANPRSAGAGLNPQHLCWEMGFVEIPTRTVAFTQAAGRIDRKGQRYNPNIRLFIARGTVQESLLNNLLSNDDEVISATASKNSIRELIFPKQKITG